MWPPSCAGLGLGGLGPGPCLCGRGLCSLPLLLLSLPYSHTAPSPVSCLLLSGRLGSRGRRVEASAVLGLPSCAGSGLVFPFPVCYLACMAGRQDMGLGDTQLSAGPTEAPSMQTAPSPTRREPAQLWGDRPVQQGLLFPLTDQLGHSYMVLSPASCLSL